jgi:hypothetical protein
MNLLTRLKLKKEVAELDMFVRSNLCWIYGFGYKRWDAHSRVFYVIPLNYVVRAALWIQWKWDTCRMKSGKVDRMIRLAVEKEHNRMAKLMDSVIREERAKTHIEMSKQQLMWMVQGIRALYNPEVIAMTEAEFIAHCEATIKKSKTEEERGDTPNGKNDNKTNS